mgnify:CR=1 FL=1
MFIISACIYAVGGLVFVFLSSAEVQSWARKPEDEVQTRVDNNKDRNRTLGNAAHEENAAEGEQLKF